MNSATDSANTTPVVTNNVSRRVRARIESSLARVSVDMALHLLRHVPAVDEPHDLVPEIGRRAEHEGTATVDHGDAVLAAILGGSGGDAASARAVVHPDTLDAELDAFAHG